MTASFTQNAGVGVTDGARLANRLARERTARKEAERLLEEQSRALYESNRKLADAFLELKAQADQTQGFLEHLPICAFIASADGVIESVNRLAARTFGVGPEVARGRPISEYLLPLGDPAVRDSEHLFDALNPHHTKARAADGRLFDCEVVAAQMAKAGQAHTIWMIRDITRRLEAERERARLEADLRQAQKLESLGTMAGGIAHELNTPIQFVTDNVNFLDSAFRDLTDALNLAGSQAPPGEADSLAATFDLDYLSTEVPEALAQSRDGLTRIAEIVLAIKRFSHPTGSEQELNDLNEIIRTTATISKNQWKYVATMNFDLAPDLPRIKSNAGEMNQVFLNLIVNAAHAIEEKQKLGPELGAITITTRSLGDTVECRISDTGVGINPTYLPRIFDLFFTTKAPGRGTGQGLSIVNTIITQSHGGKIDVDSELGKGTTFIVTLPVCGKAEGSRAG